MLVKNYGVDSSILKVIFIGFGLINFSAYVSRYILEKMKSEIKIFLAAPRGFCAGVERAIEIVNQAIKKYGTPVYVRHEIVHNKQVVETLKSKGAIFVEELSEIKDKTRPVIFSAHGVPKKVPEEARLNNLTFVDATCPWCRKYIKNQSKTLKKVTT